MTVTYETPEAIAEKLHHVRVLCEQGRCITEAVRQVGMAKQTYYRWRRQYEGLSPQEIRCIKQLMIESRWSADRMH